MGTKMAVICSVCRRDFPDLMPDKGAQLSTAGFAPPHLFGVGPCLGAGESLILIKASDVAPIKPRE